MKLEFDAKDLTSEWDREMDLPGVMREAVEQVTRKFIKAMVQEELDKASEPIRAILKRRTDLMLQVALDEVRDMPDTTIMDALVYGQAKR